MLLQRFILFSTIVQMVMAGEIQSKTVYSTAMDTALPLIVVLPERYDQTTKPLPTLYLLHGWSGSYRDWSAKMDLPEVADKYGIIIVCPEGGYAGWYLDSPVNARNRFTTYIGREVVAWVDQNYRTESDRRHRAITGLSMGGHGALYIAGIFSDTFGGAGSMSGVMDLTQTRFADDIRVLMGLTDREALFDYSVMGNRDRLWDLSPVILIDCGVDDAFISANRDLHNELVNMGLAHTYIERPGGHSWDYWTHALTDHIVFFTKALHW